LPHAIKLDKFPFIPHDSEIKTAIILWRFYEEQQTNKSAAK